MSGGSCSRSQIDKIYLNNSVLNVRYFNWVKLPKTIQVFQHIGSVVRLKSGKGSRGVI